jgi:hypothetical protein
MVIILESQNQGKYKLNKKSIYCFFSPKIIKKKTLSITSILNTLITFALKSAGVVFFFPWFGLPFYTLSP